MGSIQSLFRTMAYNVYVNNVEVWPRTRWELWVDKEQAVDVFEHFAREYHHVTLVESELNCDQLLVSRKVLLSSC